MTGDTTLENRRSEFLNNVKQLNKRSTIMLDKEVQYEPPEIMYYEGTDSGIGGSGDLTTVTVAEINNSPTPTAYESRTFSTSAFSNSTEMSEMNLNDVSHSNSIIRRESFDKLHELDELNLCPDTTDCSTVPVTFHRNSILDNSRLDNESADEIREQSSLVVLNNCVSNEEKLQELSEKKDESNCFLDCLSFAIQCCDCTIL